MVQALPAPEVLRCYFDESFDPHLAAMYLRWDETGLGWGERLWELPDAVSVRGPAPRRFGVSIDRQTADSYSVRLLWDKMCFNWLSLGRDQIVNSALAPLLGALGTDLWYILDQPLEPALSRVPGPAMGHSTRIERKAGSNGIVSGGEVTRNEILREVG